MSETQEIEINDNTERRGRGRPKKNPDECKSLDKDYFKKYYLKTCLKVICPYCGCETNKRNISNHKKSRICEAYSMMKDLQNEKSK
jgi:hypothetical protein